MSSSARLKVGLQRAAQLPRPSGSRKAEYWPDEAAGHRWQRLVKPRLHRLRSLLMSVLPAEVVRELRQPREATQSSPAEKLGTESVGLQLFAARSLWPVPQKCRGCNAGHEQSAEDQHRHRVYDFPSALLGSGLSGYERCRRRRSQKLHAADHETRVCR